eukprot:355460-Chlamydomonas_euryale.AAC.1
MAIEASVAASPGNVAWSVLVKKGFGATGPMLGSSPPAATAPAPAGAWGKKSGGAVGATVGSGAGSSSGAAPLQPQPAAAPRPAAGPWGADMTLLGAPARPGIAGAAATPGTSSNPADLASSSTAAQQTTKSKSKSKGTLLFSTSQAQRKY